MNTIQQWLDAKYNLDKYKAIEKELRLIVLDQVFPSASEGTFNSVVGDLEVKGSFKVTTSININDYYEIQDSLSQEAEACLSWKPSFLKTKFAELEEDDKNNLERCLTYKPALPTLSIKAIEE